MKGLTCHFYTDSIEKSETNEQYQIYILEIHFNKGTAEQIRNDGEMKYKQN